MKRTKKYEILEVQQDLVAESRSTYGLRTYVSLFSSAGVGCYGFKVAGYHCLATVELIERRLNIQRYNQKCIYESGYICGDLTQEETQQKVFDQIKLWACYGVKEPDVLIATPPCQDNFRPCYPHMEAWIAGIKEKQSVFNNTDPAKIPHTVRDGVLIYNAHKNGDKYTRQCWDKVA